MSLPQLPDLNKIEEPKKQKTKKQKEKKERKGIIPKSQYDEDGNPILLIPDLNDVDLTDEIEKYFGTNREGD